MKTRTLRNSRLKVSALGMGYTGISFGFVPEKNKIISLTN